MLLTCLYGKPENVELLVVGSDGRDAALERAGLKVTALPEQFRLEPGEPLFRVSRHRFDGQIWTWIGLYRHADAIGSARPGGFYGAALLFRDTKVDSEAIIDWLGARADSLAEGVLDGGRFYKKLSQIAPNVDDSLYQSLRPSGADYRSGLSVDAHSGVYLDLTAEPNRLGALIEQAQQDRAFCRDSAIFLGASTRLGEIAAQSVRTTGIEAMRPDDYLARPEPEPETPPEPPTPPPPTAVRASRSSSATSSASMSQADVDQLIRRRLGELLPAALAEALPVAAGQRRGRNRMRDFLEGFVATAVLLLLFLASVFLALNWMKPEPRMSAAYRPSAATPPAEPAFSLPEERQPALIDDNGTEETTAPPDPVR